MQPNIAQQPKQLKVQPSKSLLEFGVIGYGNARYNSALCYKDHLIISCTALLKLIDVEKKKVLFQTQVGNSQITQIDENTNHIVVINFEGLVTFLNKDNLQKVCEFRTSGKDVRHSCVDDQYFAVSSEIVEGYEGALLEIYRIDDILKGNYVPMFSKKAYFYYPEIHEGSFTVLEFHDPNPHSKARKDTVLEKKLPITNRILQLESNLANATDFVFREALVPHQSEIICATRNRHLIFYLHNDKHLTIYNIKDHTISELDIKHIKTPLMALEAYKNGVVLSATNKSLLYVEVDQNGKVHSEEQAMPTSAAPGCFCLKFDSKGGLFTFNDSGLHHYNPTTKSTSSLQLFDITNCGLAINHDGTMIAIGDFAGCVYIYSTQLKQCMNFEPLFQTFAGTPIRALTWVEDQDYVVIGTIGGSLFKWDYKVSPDCELIDEFGHNINILRHSRSKIIVGTSQGDIVLVDTKDIKTKHAHKAHHPVHYEDPKDRELFGSMKYFAEIWSLTTSPDYHEEFYISSCSEDQFKKIFRVCRQEWKFEEVHALPGHELAVTSIDWKRMDSTLGEVYISCSDDKKIIVRDPKKGFQVVEEIETRTIREWHTLTYLALEEGGRRVAIGSQNGFLFIYNLVDKDFEYAEKIHLGGIEGLVWKGNNIITISSDLCINIMKVPA